MWNKRPLGGPKMLIVVVALLLSMTSAPLKAGQSETTQAQVLADIAFAVVTCSSHPCLGDSEKDVRKEIHNKIVSDDVYYYSNLTEAYPSASKVLSGLVEWDLESELNMVSLKVMEFRVEPSVFLAELERAIPGCQMESDDEEDVDSANDQDAGEEDSTRAWSCSGKGKVSDDILVEVYFAHGMVLLEMGP